MPEIDAYLIVPDEVAASADPAAAAESPFPSSAFDIEPPTAEPLWNRNRIDIYLSEPKDAASIFCGV